MSEYDSEYSQTSSATTALGQRLIANALRYRPAAARETKNLRSLRHDANLVPKITNQLRFLLDNLHRDTNVTYDIQGMSDEGSDILVRLQAPGEARYVGIQVKSHPELSQKSLVKDLRDQLSRSED